MELTQAEADNLIALPKYRLDDKQWMWPKKGTQINIPLESEDKHENFYLDILQNNIALKVTYQTRFRKTKGLLRLDLGGAPHKNPYPDNTIIPCPHLHIYKAGYDLKYAYPVPSDFFVNLDDLPQTLYNFMEYCNIIKFPIIAFSKQQQIEYEY